MRQVSIDNESLDVLELVAMYDPTPATGFGVLPGNEGRRLHGYGKRDG